MKIQMTLRKQTKGTFVYEEISNDLAVELAVPTLYIRKDAMAQLIGTGTIPNEITVTVTV